MKKPLSEEELDALADTLERAMRHNQIDLSNGDTRACTPDRLEIAIGNEDDERDFLEITLPPSILNYLIDPT